MKNQKWKRSFLGSEKVLLGLCKRASKEEVTAQDYCLNRRRYVGVVIEEDSKNEEEFGILRLNEKFNRLNSESGNIGKLKLFFAIRYILLYNNILI